MTIITTLSSKGQMTIPKEIRDYFNLKKNDKLLLTTDNNTLLVKPLTKSFLDLGGSIKPKEKPEDFTAIRKKVMKKISEQAVKNR